MDSPALLFTFILLRNDSTGVGDRGHRAHNPQDNQLQTPPLAAIYIGALYRILQDSGVSQRQIAALTGQSQSEVSDIVAGRRKVENHQLLRRIATGLGIPSELMGLSWWAPDGTWYGSGGAYPEKVTVADPPEGDDDKMRRRAVILAAPVALWGHPLFGRVPELPAPDWLVGTLPSRLGMMHVEAVTDLLTQLRGWARAWGGQAEVLGAVAAQSTRLLTVPGEDRIRARLGSVLAELHTEAGWTYFDSGADDAANYHYCRALAIARQFGDRYQMAHALHSAGRLPLERGRLNDSLKLFQLGQIAFMPLDGARVVNDPRIPPMTASLDSQQARALARMDLPDQARSKLATARDKWQAPDAFAQADADYRNADIAVCLGQLDVAEQFAGLSVRAWGDQDRRPAASARILLATIHVRAGEPRGLQLAHNAITAATKLSSVRVRHRLLPLADELDTRRGSDYQQLARVARRVAVARP
ncbi:MAG TPA: helix-turn-helix domain-containing protein [Pseudonocardiaceae bacterium]|nr:helix-turn-helix domain-containing protein [Pseudonocardiaceae bacterium]